MKAEVSAVVMSAWVLVSAACVSTDIEGPQPAVCAARRDPRSLAASVVRVRLDGPLRSLCNAVVIAPTLLLTATNCVAEVAAPEDFRTGFTAPRCTPSGAVREDGSFIDRFATLAEPESITIQRDDGLPFDARVEQIFVASAESTCMPSFAVLELQFPLDVPLAPAPVQLVEVPLLGREVLVIGFDVSTDELQRHVQPATVSEVTGDTGSDTLAPRSLMLSGKACAFSGGAVLDMETGALVGSIRASELNLNCFEGVGAPLAVRVAPYRRLLLEAAAAAGASLLAEPRLQGAVEIPPCPDEL